MANPERLFEGLKEYNEPNEIYIDPSPFPEEQKQQIKGIKNAIRTVITYSNESEYEVDIQIKNGTLLWNLPNLELRRLKERFYEDETERKIFYDKLDVALTGFEKIVITRKHAPQIG